MELANQIELRLVQNDEEIVAMKELQNANLKPNLTRDEQEAEGFVTSDYPLKLLRFMHSKCASVIAVDRATQKVVGYVMATPKDEIYGMHGLLDEFFDHANPVIYKERQLQDTNYIIIGQLCVAKGYKGLNLARKMYEYFKEVYSSKYECCVTDVDEANHRSIRAHEKTGFQIVHTVPYGGSRWHIVLWDWWS
jgi:ribosomal protein S18 acetylase RimI-like enzyme